MKFIFIKFVRFYQLFISPILPASCRHYPSCSEYSLWQFKHNSFFGAFFATILRILKCNQFFKGGIDYPIVKANFSPISVFSKTSVKKPNFWLIPNGKNRYFVVKSII